MNAAGSGLVAMFCTPEEFLEALRRTRAAGYTRVEVNVPYAVEGMTELLPGKPTPMARIVLIAGLTGASGGYFMQWYAARDYPIDVGGRPLHSWPAFVPVTFELMVLAAAVAGCFALLWLTRLPRLDHPLFAIPEFRRATQDRFFLSISADDPRFQPGPTRIFLQAAGAELVTEVPV